MNDEIRVRSLTTELHNRLAEVEDVARYATVNIPKGFSNIGSHLLFLSEAHYFRSTRGAELRYASAAETYSPPRMRAALGDDGVIVLRGGYLGDQWDHRGGRRRVLFESIVRDFRDHRIVLMPQSVEYFDPAKEWRAAETFALHPNLTLLIRENRSFANAQRLFPTCRLIRSPDIVFHLADIAGTYRTERTERSVLYLCREDWEGGEQFSAERLKIPGLTKSDWRIEANAQEVSDFARWKEDNPISGVLNSSRFKDHLWHAAWLLCLAISQLRRHRLVITNRLHGHIMCCLLGIPHVLVPGPYQKMSSFYESWTRSMNSCRFAVRGDQVRDAAAELLALQGETL